MLHCRRSVVFTRLRQCAPIYYMLSLAHPRPHSKQRLDRFNHFCVAQGRRSLYFTMGRPFSHQVAPSLPMGESRSHLIHGSLGPPDSTPSGISIGSAVFAGLTIVTDRPIDRPRYSVCSNRPHLRSTAMWLNNIKWSKNFDERPHRRGFIIGEI